MLLECYLVGEDGEATKVEKDKLKLNSNSLAIIVVHTNRCIYVFKGRNVSIVQKFASARTASQMRLQYGYKIDHIEEAEGIGESFKPILEFLGGMAEEEPQKQEQPMAKELNVSATTQMKSPPKEKEEMKKEPQNASIVEQKKEQIKTPKVDLLKFEAEHPVKIVKVLKELINLEPPKESECDYLVIGNQLFLIKGKNKKDLRFGDFQLEEMTTLPDGIFPAKDYFPRLIISKNKIIAVELWAKR